MINYITQLNLAFAKFCSDNRLNPFHISLYFSLFQFWNLAKFRNPISINRAEMMSASKIGSANTYTKCLKELHSWGYIKYEPSHSPLIGSKVYMYTFNKTTNKTPDNATDISANKSTDKTDEKVLRPSLNSLNKTNKLNSKNHERTRSKNSKKFISLHSRKTIGEGKSKQKSSAPRAAVAGQTRPLLKEITNHFTSKQWPAIEAEKFFNYYQSNGWLVGGKTPMRNWKAASQNWMINSEKFGKQNTRLVPGKLHTTKNKDYAEPL